MFKSIAELKRVMLPGTKWHTTHQYTGKTAHDMGVRECGLNNSVDFGFIDPESGNISHSRWPTSSQFEPIENGFKINGEFFTLTYTVEE